MPGGSAPAAAASPPPTRSTIASPICASRRGSGAHFDEIVYSAALGVCKPDRVFFTDAQARMGVTVAQSILFVDDTAANVDGARACGWRADALSRAGEPRAGARELGLGRRSPARSGQMIACMIIQSGTSTVGHERPGQVLHGFRAGAVMEDLQAASSVADSDAERDGGDQGRAMPKAFQRCSTVVCRAGSRASHSSGRATTPVMMSPHGGGMRERAGQPALGRQQQEDATAKTRPILRPTSSGSGRLSIARRADGQAVASAAARSGAATKRPHDRETAARIAAPAGGAAGSVAMPDPQAEQRGQSTSLAPRDASMTDEQCWTTKTIRAAVAIGPRGNRA